MNSDKYVHALLLSQGKHVKIPMESLCFSKTCLYLSFQSMSSMNSVSLSTGMQNTLVHVTYFVLKRYKISLITILGDDKY